MSQTATAIDGETLDHVLYRTTGTTQGVEALMMSDASLVDTLFLAPGQAVTLPDHDASVVVTNKQWVNLWQ